MGKTLVRNTGSLKPGSLRMLVDESEINLMPRPIDLSPDIHVYKVKSLGAETTSINYKPLRPIEPSFDEIIPAMKLTKPSATVISLLDVPFDDSFSEFTKISGRRDTVGRELMDTTLLLPFWADKGKMLICEEAGVNENADWIVVRSIDSSCSIDLADSIFSTGRTAAQRNVTECFLIPGAPEGTTLNVEGAYLPKCLWTNVNVVGTPAEGYCVDISRMNEISVDKWGRIIFGSDSIYSPVFLAGFKNSTAADYVARFNKIFATLPPVRVAKEEELS